MALILVLITGSLGVLVENVIATNDSILSSKMHSVLPLDRGYVGRPPVRGTLDLSSQDMITLTDELLEQLHCSFVFSQLAYMYLTEMYVKDATILSNVAGDDWMYLIFTDEAKYILNVLYNDQADNSTKVVGWIFAMYAERAAVFFESYRHERDHGGGSNRFMLSAHNAVVTVLEEHVDSRACPVYNRETGDLEIVNYKDRILQYLDGKAGNGPKLTNSLLKLRFARQRKENAKHGLPEMGVERFETDALRLTDFMKNQHATHELDMAFGVQLDWQAIWNELDTDYMLSCSSDTTLHQQITSLVQFQSNVLLVLEAIAMRIVIGYMMVIKQKLCSSGGFVSSLSLTYYYLPKYNNIMTKYLADLTVCVSNRRAMEMITNSIQNLKNDEQIDYCSDTIFKLLTEMSQHNENFKSFRTPIEENEEYSKLSMIEVDKVAEKYQIDQSMNVNVNDSVRESLVSMQVFSGYVKNITQTVDLEVMKSLLSLNGNPVYNRLKQIEEMEEIEKDERKVHVSKLARIFNSIKKLSGK